MGNQRFVYDKIVRTGTLSLPIITDYHPSYPVGSIQNIWRDYVYRSKYGTGSGWGYFKITSSNQWIDFSEGGGELNAQISTGDYDADTLATAIKTAMDTAGALTYTITYDEGLNKFILAASGTFSLLWQSGTNSANSMGDTLGFDVSADDTGLSSYTADYVRIHTEAVVEMESYGSLTVSTKSCVLYGLNLTASPATFKLQRYTGSWVDVATFDYDEANHRAICFYSEVSAVKYRIYIQDPTNSDGYIQIGTILLGDYEELSRGYEYGASADVEDTSVHMYSKAGYLTVAVGFKKKRRAVVYEVLEADEQKLENVFDLVGKQFPFVFVSDSVQAKETMEYAIFKDRFGRRIEGAYFRRIGLVWEYEIK